MYRTHSDRYFHQAKKLLVGGVNSPVRSFKGVGGQPLVMKYGRGVQFFDYDNNAFTDYCLSWGSLILGHAHPNVIRAIKKTAQKGLSFGTTTREEIALAELIVERVPSIERIRFVNSGTEATMSAVRLARGFTGRDLVIKFDGCYHGHMDALLTQAGSGVAMLAESSSRGIPASQIQDTFSLRYNDIEQLKNTFEKYGDRVACVILEPVAGNMGVIPGDKEFLKTLRELTQQHGALLIFDEIMTGFRTATGCVQSEVGITPDLTCLGKIIGGGFPIGAYGGREDIMMRLAPEGDVYQAGTFSGNPVVMRAGATVLRLLTPKFYERLNERCAEMLAHLNDFFAKYDIDVHMSGYRSMMSIRFRRELVSNYDDAQAAAGGDRYGALFRYLLQAGIYWPPADLEAFFVSGFHSRHDLDALVTALEAFFKEENVKAIARL